MNYLEGSQSALQAASATQEALRKFFSETAELSGFALQAIGTVIMEREAKKKVDRGMEISLGGETLLDRNTNIMTAEHGDLIAKLIDAPVGTKIEGAEDFNLKLYGQKLIKTDAEGIVTQNFWQSKEALNDPKVQAQKNDFKSMLTSLRPEQDADSLTQMAKIEVPTGVKETDREVMGRDVWDNEEYPDIEWNRDDWEEWAGDNLSADAAINSRTDGSELEYDENIDLAEFGFPESVEHEIQGILAEKNAAVEGVEYYEGEEEEKLDTKERFDDRTELEIAEADKAEREERAKATEEEIEIEIYSRDPIGESGHKSVEVALENLPQSASVAALLNSVKSANLQLKQSPAQQSAAQDVQSEALSIPKSGNLEPLDRDSAQLQETMQGIKNLSAVMMEPDERELITERYRIERLQQDGVTEYKVFDRQDPDLENAEPVLAFSDTGLVLSASKQTEEPDKEISLRVNVGQAQESIKKREAIISEFAPRDDGAIERYQTFTGMAGAMQEKEFATKHTTGFEGDGKLEVSIEGNGSMYVKQTIEGKKKDILEMDGEGNIGKMDMSSKDMRNAQTVVAPKIPVAIAAVDEEEKKVSNRRKM